MNMVINSEYNCHTGFREELVMNINKHMYEIHCHAERLDIE
jgi:hypothetical protein